jgi:Fe-S-cluster containining protein
MLPYLPSDAQSIGDDEDRRWLLEDLTIIPRREGLARSPHLTQGGVTRALVDGDGVLMWSFFYECRHFDPETRRCTNYDSRPPACRDYPLYGAPSLDPAKAIPEACTYRETPVEIGATR